MAKWIEKLQARWNVKNAWQVILILVVFACTGFTLVGTLVGGPALVHVTQQIKDRVTGGLTILITPERVHKHEHHA